VAVICPAINLNKVDFPVPFLPITAQISPVFILKTYYSPSLKINIIFTISIKCFLRDKKCIFFEYFVNIDNLFAGGNILKTINYKNPIVASYLFIAGIFIVLGFSQGLIFFLIGVLSVLGIKENNKLT